MDTTQISLLERLRSRPDEESWRRLVAIYAPFIERWLRQKRIAVQDAEDISQEVLADVHVRLQEFVHSGRTGAFRRWLGLIVYHRSVDYWRKKHPDSPGEIAQLSEIEDPDSQLSRQWDVQHDLHVMQRLLTLIEPEFTATTWQAFHRIAILEARPSQVASDLGMTINAVLLAKFRVLKRLREEAAGLVD